MRLSEKARACPFESRASGGAACQSRQRKRRRAESGRQCCREWDLMCEVPSTSWAALGASGDEADERVYALWREEGGD